MATHSHPTELDSFTLDHGLWTKVRNVIVFLFLISAAATAAGYFIDQKQFFHSYLAGFMWSTRILLGAMFFLLAGYLAGAAWNVTVRRFSETMVATIPYGLILFIPVAFGIHDLYHWSHAEVVSADKILQGKAIWLKKISMKQSAYWNNRRIIIPFVFISSLCAISIFKKVMTTLR